MCLRAQILLQSKRADPMETSVSSIFGGWVTRCLPALWLGPNADFIYAGGLVLLAPV